MSPHDAPSAGELIEAVREWIERDVVTATDGRLKFHARVAVNALRIVERELVVGAEQAVAHADRLTELGVTSDEELAAAIRDGRFESEAEAEKLRGALRASVVDKLRVANPDYLDEADRVNASS